jgi:uncharacterized membrane protein
MAEQRTSPAPSFEEVPLTRNEYITAMVHFYRGEMNRANTWRNRLDATTNWAVVTVGAMLTFAFGDVGHPHTTLLLTNLLILIFLGFEARRFRYFDVWRSRIRMIEENFFLPIIRRNLVSPRSDWREWVAEDLDHPKFKITFLQAVGTRLRRNYLAIFAVVLLAWIGKLSLHPAPTASLREAIGRARMGPLPGPAALGLVAACYAALLWVALHRGGGRPSSDEVVGVEHRMEHWKT